MSSIAKCHDCGLVYGDPGWIETHLPQDVWKEIAPNPEGHGILCINCISRRLAERGFKDVPIVLCGMEPITPVIDTTTAQFIAHGLSIMLILELERAAAEMRRQNAKWGQQDHDAYEWVSIIGEEFGEVFKALNEDDEAGYRKELIETAACCLQAAANLKIRFKEKGGLPANTVQS